MAHLCGSLGVLCIVLLNAPCDWRWGQEGDRSFLYESVRLLMSIPECMGSCNEFCRSYN